MAFISDEIIRELCVGDSSESLFKVFILRKKEIVLWLSVQTGCPDISLPAATQLSARECAGTVADSSDRLFLNFATGSNAVICAGMR